MKLHQFFQRVGRIDSPPQESLSLREKAESNPGMIGALPGAKVYCMVIRPPCLLAPEVFGGWRVAKFTKIE